MYGTKMHNGVAVTRVHAGQGEKRERKGWVDDENETLSWFAGKRKTRRLIENVR